MRRMLLRVLVAAAATAALATAALADVQIQLAISPSSIPQCGTGQLMVALGNTGTSPVAARVCFSFQKNGVTIFGPACGRVYLAAGEQRTHNFTFIIPSLMPAGSYALVASATGSDGSTSQSTAAFTVTAGTCLPGASIVTGDAALQSAILGIGAQPDAPLPVKPSTWGTLKIRYR